ncbi:DUF2345 domain-containing protein, partial [Chitinibacter sp. ZOR0017]|uniref:DUF2345 domain-containing protein n=1 Tax=Chitinibacter sp. ZOR0017 TaxID=1339254 RepID=UPI000647FDAB
KSLGEVATKQLADTIETGENDQTIKPDNSNGEKNKTGHLHHHVHAAKSWEAGSNTDTDGKTKSEDQAGQQPLLILHGQDGLALTTPQSITQTAGTNIDQISQRDHNQTTGRRWIHNVGQHISLFVSGVKDKVALKLIAAKGKVQIQAQSDDVEITADKNVKLTAIKGQNLFNAKQEILLTAGGAYIRIKGGKIELHAPGKVSFKGASHDWSGGTSQGASYPAMPQPGDHWIGVHFTDPDGDPIEKAPYKIRFENGATYTGKLDVMGKAKHVSVPHETAKVSYELPPPKDEKPFDPLQELVGKVNQKLAGKSASVSSEAAK